jgi:hypothetical protein
MFIRLVAAGDKCGTDSFRSYLTLLLLRVPESAIVPTHVARFRPIPLLDVAVGRGKQAQHLIVNNFTDARIEISKERYRYD